MFKNAIKFECSLNNRVFTFVFESDAPTTDLKEILFQITKYIGQFEDSVKKQQEEQQKLMDLQKTSNESETIIDKEESNE